MQGITQLFRQKSDGQFEMKPASSSPPDIKTRMLVPEYAFDPTEEAKPRDETALEILREIRDILKDQSPNPSADNFRPRVFSLEAPAGEIATDIRNGYENIYVSPVPRITNIYLGNSNILLASLTVGKSLRAHIPYRLDQIRISYAAGLAGDTIYVVLTTDPFDISIY